VALLSAPAVAGVGDLTYAKGPAVGRGTTVQFATPRKIPGTGGNGDLVVASGKFGGRPIQAALTGTKGFDSLRLDLTGKGDFRKAPRIPVRTMRKSKTAYTATIGPAQVELANGGKPVPVTVSGHYYESRGRPRLYLYLTAMVEGSCAFGSTVRKVRITDASGNLRFDDAVSGTPRGRYDTILLADENGRFPSSRTAGTALGHPMQVDGAWYTPAVKGMKVSARRATCAMGKVSGKGDKWQLSLRGRKYTLTVDGGSEPVEIPADTYQVSRCNYYDTGSAGSSRAVVSTYPHLSVKVEAGKTVAIPMGMPIKVKMAATARGGKVSFSVKQTDAAGSRILSITNSKGGRVKAPAIDVLDKAGKLVYTAQLEYG